MSDRRRLALLLVGLPLAFYAYACSSDSTDDGGGSQADGGVEAGKKPASDGSTGSDGSVGPAVDAGVDASDGAVAPACVGNPLTADGGTSDGGTTLDAAVAQTIVSVPNGEFIDGPQWVDTATGGFLVYSEFNNGRRIARIAEDGGAGATFRGMPGGQDIGALGSAVSNGMLLTVVSDRRPDGGAASVVFQTALDGGAAPTILLSVDGGGGSPNDLVIGKGGTVYITDPRFQQNPPRPPTGILSMASDGGSLTRAVAFATGGEKPNGIALSPDGTKLYVGFTDPPRIFSYPVSAAGVLASNGTPFIAAEKLVDLPDGLAVDVAGNVYVAEAHKTEGVFSGRVSVFSSTGQKWGEIAVPDGRPTSVAFGGTDKKTLFITLERGIRVYKGRCAGLADN